MNSKDICSLMKFNILPIPFSQDDSNTNNSDQSGFNFEYEMHKWDVKFKESKKNFISINIEYSNNKKTDFELSLPFKIVIKFDNNFQHNIINHLSNDYFYELIPVFYESNQQIQVEAYLIPFLPVICPKNYMSLYYSAYCCFFMTNYFEKKEPIIENKNNNGNDDIVLIDKQEIIQANSILRSLIYRPVPIDLFTFYLNNFTVNEKDPIPSSYDFSLLDYSAPTIQETISSIIFSYFSRIFNIKLDCFDKIEENSQNLSYLTKISKDSFALVFLNPSTYEIDKNFQITNKVNKMNYILYSMITQEGRDFCSYYYSFNLNKGFKFCEGDCIEFELDKWPHNASIITIFIRNDVVENFKKQNQFAVYKNNLEQSITVYQYDLRDIDFQNKKYIEDLVNELQDKKETNWFYGCFKTSRFSALSNQNALLFKYDPIENIFPSFPSIDFNDSCIMITPFPSKFKKFVYQLIWFQKVTEECPINYFLESKKDFKNRIYSSESVFLPSVQLIKQSDDLKKLFSLNQIINEHPNQTIHWKLAAVKNHCIQMIPFEQEYFNINILKFSLVFFACENSKDMIPIAIRFGRHSQADAQSENLNFNFTINDGNDNNSNDNESNNDFYNLDNYDDKGKLIFYGTPKLIYKKESDFPLFIQSVQKCFENFTIFYRYIEKKDPQISYKWKQIVDPTKDLEILKNDAKDQPIQQQIYHLMLIQEND